MMIPGGKLLMEHVAKVVVSGYRIPFEKWEAQRAFISSLPRGNIEHADCASCENPKCCVVLARSDIIKCKWCDDRYCRWCLVQGECPDCYAPCEYTGCKNGSGTYQDQGGSFHALACAVCSSTLCEEHIEYCRHCMARLCFDTENCINSHQCERKNKRSKKE